MVGYECTWVWRGVVGYECTWVWRGVVGYECTWVWRGVVGYECVCMDMCGFISVLKLTLPTPCSGDPLSNMNITFDTQEQAIAFAQKNGNHFISLYAVCSRVCLCVCVCVCLLP